MVWFAWFLENGVDVASGGGLYWVWPSLPGLAATYLEPIVRFIAPQPTTRAYDLSSYTNSRYDHTS